MSTNMQDVEYIIEYINKYINNMQWSCRITFSSFRPSLQMKMLIFGFPAILKIIL